MARVIQQNGEIRVLLGRCKDCEHFEPFKKDKGFGRCFCEKFVYEEHVKSPTTDMLIYGDYEGYYADFYVGENFGCIHFKPKRG